MSLIATVLLVLSLIPIMVVAMPAIVSLIGNGTIAGFVVFVLAGLATGHLLGGPESESRIVLALSSASRHPAVALVIASVSFPGERLVLAALLLCLIVNVALSTPYVLWQRRRL